MVFQEDNDLPPRPNQPAVHKAELQLRPFQSLHRAQPNLHRLSKIPGCDNLSPANRK